MSRFMLGVDVGGTFTDFVAYDADTQSVQVWKNLTTPDDPT
ncbi:MAG: hydantoinase/oxoprolinase N-terminal domain-containing protein, partial [Gammaproteobacteria bacterium]